MGVTYAKETALAEMDPVAMGIRLAELLAATMSWLSGVAEERASAAPAEDKWSAKEVLGHLVDSAVNNLQRIVRLEIRLDIEPEVHAEPYEQEEWVRAQAYAAKEWLQILDLWRALNEHIAWTMRQVERSHLGRLCVFPDETVTMGFLMEDYIAHMEHHLEALKVWL